MADRLKALEEAKKKAREAREQKEKQAAITAPASSSSSSTTTAVVPGKKQGGLIKVNADTLLKNVKMNFSDVIVVIVQEIKDDPELFMFSGGIHPVDRRLTILDIVGLKVSHLKWFVATTELRGHHIVAFAKRSDDTGTHLADLQSLMNFKGKRGVDVGGKYSVVSVKVCLSDLFIAFRKEMGPAKYRDAVYSGRCPVMYQWNGSMGAMYDPIEETSQEDAFLKYMLDYEDFQDWYIKVRSDAAKQSGQAPKIKRTPEELAKAIVDQKIKQRSFYKLSLGTFSKETRKAWSTGDFTVEITKGPIQDDGYIATLVTAAFG